MSIFNLSPVSAAVVAAEPGQYVARCSALVFGGNHKPFNAKPGETAKPMIRLRFEIGITEGDDDEPVTVYRDFTFPRSLAHFKNSDGEMQRPALGEFVEAWVPGLIGANGGGDLQTLAGKPAKVTIETRTSSRGNDYSFVVAANPLKKTPEQFALRDEPVMFEGNNRAAWLRLSEEDKEFCRLGGITFGTGAVVRR
jgi:hypothetical protein